MKNVVFVAPFLLPTTVRFLTAAARLNDVRIGVISHDNPSSLPAPLKQDLLSWGKMGPGMDAQAIMAGAQEVMKDLGPVHCVLGMLEQLQTPIAKVREVLGLDGLHVEQAQNFRDKARMKTLLREAGLPCAKHRVVTSVRDGVDFTRMLGGPVVVKPPDGAGAIATYRCGDVEEVVRVLGAMGVSGQRPFLCEEFVLGEEKTLEVVSVNGQPVWHSMTEYAPTPLDVLRNPWIQWTVTLPREVEDQRYDDVRSAGYAALKVLGMGTGLSHMEWFRRPDGTLAISEIGARPPGAQIMKLMSYATDVDMHSAWAELMVHGTFEPPERKYAAGAAFLRGQGQGRVVSIEGVEAAQEAVGQWVVEANLPGLGQAKGKGYEGEGYAIVRARETEQVRDALAKIIRTVQVKLA